MRYQGGFAQGDVKTYYGLLDLILIASDMLDAGVSAALLATMLRVQLVPPVELSLSVELRMPLRRRTLGSIVGSRVAGAAGGWPLERSGRALMPAPALHGLQPGDDLPPLVLAASVDNIYAIATTGASAVRIFDDLEAPPPARWRLQ